MSTGRRSGDCDCDGGVSGCEANAVCDDSTCRASLVPFPVPVLVHVVDLRARGDACDALDGDALLFMSSRR